MKTYKTSLFSYESAKDFSVMNCTLILFCFHQNLTQIHNNLYHARVNATQKSLEISHKFVKVCISVNLVLVFKKVESKDKTKYDNFYSSPKEK